jgi:hypothetical protein
MCHKVTPLSHDNLCIPAAAGKIQNTHPDHAWRMQPIDANVTKSATIIDSLLNLVQYKIHTWFDAF